MPLRTSPKVVRDDLREYLENPRRTRHHAAACKSNEDLYWVLSNQVRIMRALEALLRIDDVEEPISEGWVLLKPYERRVKG